jgi:hypothetical protein
LKKKQEKEKFGMTRQDPSRPGYKSVVFCFFLYLFLLKRRRFDFKKKTDPANPVTQSKINDPVKTRTGHQTRS